MDPRSPRVWRPRHAAVFAFLRRHCATTAQLAHFFGGRTLEVRAKQAARWVVRQRRRRRIRIVGLVQRRETGRPEIVYGRRCRLRQIEHEVRVTDFALLYPDHPLERDVAVGDTEADGALTVNGRRCYVEVDNSGRMTANQIRAKWRAYVGVTDLVLVVCLTDARMDRLRAWSDAVADIALFSTFDRLRSGEAAPWVSVGGETAPR